MLHCEKKVHDKVLNPETEPTRPSVSDSLVSTCSMSYSPSCSSLISSLKSSLSTVTPLPSSKLRQNLHIILPIFHLKIRLNLRLKLRLRKKILKSIWVIQTARSVGFEEIKPKRMFPAKKQ